MQKGARLLRSELDCGNMIYNEQFTTVVGSRPDDSFEGVSTGFGGKADTRKRMFKEFQATFVRELNAGIVTNPSIFKFHSRPDSKRNHSK